MIHDFILDFLIYPCASDKKKIMLLLRFNFELFITIIHIKLKCIDIDLFVKISLLEKCTFSLDIFIFYSLNEKYIFPWYFWIRYFSLLRYLMLKIKSFINVTIICVGNEFSHICCRFYANVHEYSQKTQNICISGEQIFYCLFQIREVV